MFYFIILLFVVGYCFIALEHPLKINKAATALILGILIWMFYILSGEGIYDIPNFGAGLADYKLAHPESTTPFIDYIAQSQLIEHLGSIAEILFFLLGAMTIVELIDSYQGFNIITDRIKTKNNIALLWLISFITFFLSAILDNMTTAIVMVALLRKLISDKKERWFYAGMVIIASNAGGAFSPIGDVTTIMLWIANKISASQIILQTFVASIVSMVVPLIAVSFFMKNKAHDAEAAVKREVSPIPQWQRTLILVLGVGILLFVPIFKTLTHLKPYMGILLGLAVLWIVTDIMKRKSKDKSAYSSILETFPRIDLSSILFFLGILLAVAGLQSIGHLSMLATGLDGVFDGNYYLINIFIGICSSIVDNVPLVAACMGMYDFPMNDMFWMFLAYCAGTGGSLLIIGSAAGVAVMGMEKIDFIWYLKKITPYAILGYLAGAGIFILMDVLLF
ncbi:MAG TPA: sodium:proton antiporter NhaD [Bacteroidales bacterium]|nr:sodium:proton antiporter NhaD [Bacteroidales bacterium]